MNPPWLTQDEVDDLCKPLRQHAAQARFIERLGLQVRRKPNGAPLVMRADFEAMKADGEKDHKSGRRRGAEVGLNMAAIMAFPTRQRAPAKLP
jgi:hypothetical protein